MRCHGLRNYNSLLLLSGLLIPTFLLIAKASMSPLTLLLWPTWFFLIGLGGQINGIGDYVYIGIVILLNGVFYVICGNILRFLYLRFVGSQEK